MKNKSNDFVRGFVCACSVMLKNHGNDTEVEEVFSGIYTSRKQLLDDGVDSYDIEILEPIIK